MMIMPLQRCQVGALSRIGMIFCSSSNHLDFDLQMTPGRYANNLNKIGQLVQLPRCRREPLFDAIPGGKFRKTTKRS